MGILKFFDPDRTKPKSCQESPLNCLISVAIEACLFASLYVFLRYFITRDVPTLDQCAAFAALYTAIAFLFKVLGSEAHDLFGRVAAMSLGNLLLQSLTV